MTTHSAVAETDSVFRWGGYHFSGPGLGGRQEVPTLVAGLSGVVAIAVANSA